MSARRVARPVGIRFLCGLRYHGSSYSTISRYRRKKSPPLAGGAVEESGMEEMGAEEEGDF